MQEVRNIVFLTIIFVFIVILKGDMNLGFYMLGDYVVFDMKKIAYAFIMISLISLLAGRVFCGWLCIVAAFRNFFGRFLPDTNKFWQIKYILVFLLVAVLYLQNIYFEKIYIKETIFFAFLGFLVFSSNVWCKNICPVGAFFSLISVLSLFRLRIGSGCKTCVECNEFCDMGLKISEEERMHECSLCYRCVEKCPYNDISFSVNPIYKRIIRNIKKG